MKPVFRRALAIELCVLLAVFCQASGGQTSSEEYQVKAAFLFHFAQLVEWPADRLFILKAFALRAEEGGLELLCEIAADVPERVEGGALDWAARRGLSSKLDAELSGVLNTMHRMVGTGAQLVAGTSGASQ